MPGGYRVSGRWAFGSACQHATWIVANCVVGARRGAPAGRGRRPAAAHVLPPGGALRDPRHLDHHGPARSGSHDFTVANLFVPAERTFDLGASPVRRPGGLYALRTMFLANAAGVPLGIARGAVESVVALAADKRHAARHGPARRGAGPAAVARADALVGSARGYIFDVVGDLWATLRTGDAPAPRQRARYRLCLAAACASCVEAVDLLYQVAGGTALYAPHPLDRALRDIHTLGQHAVFSPKTFETAGSLLLGLEPDPRSLQAPGVLPQPAGGHDVGAAPEPPPRHSASSWAAVCAWGTSPGAGAGGVSRRSTGRGHDRQRGVCGARNAVHGGSLAGPRRPGSVTAAPPSGSGVACGGARRPPAERGRPQ